MILLVNVVLFIPLNIFSLAIIYLSSRIGLTVKFSFKSFLTTSHISLYFLETSSSSVTNDIFFSTVIKIFNISTHLR